jgi:hypothetical protein
VGHDQEQDPSKAGMQDSSSKKHMTEEMKRDPGSWQDKSGGTSESQPPSTTSEPGYGGSPGQQQPPQGGERPDWDVPGASTDEDPARSNEGADLAESRPVR